MRALLVVDVQYDFCPGGGLAVPDGDQIIPVTNELMDHFDHVLLTQDWHPEGHHSFASAHEGKEAFSMVEMDYGMQILWPDHCIQGTRGAAFPDELDVDRAELIIRKGFRAEIDSYSAFFENDRSTPTGLAGYLREREIETLYIAGLALDFCVYWSSMDGKKLGFQTLVVKDASRAIDQDGSLDDALANMRRAGVEMVSSDDVRTLEAAR